MIIVKINSKKPEKEKIKLAARILKEGGLVAFPTDTVYGLAADAGNAEAVKKIYKVKKRPRANPLPILIAQKIDLKKYIKTRNPDESRAIKKLTDKFWPGPLTLVLKKKKNISDIVTAGLPRVGVRVAAHPVVSRLIETLGRPLAVTSANISDKKSPATADAVKKYFNNKIELILDGGKTKLGRESTVLNCTISPPTLLRSGAISKNTLEKIIGKIKTDH